MFEILDKNAEELLIEIIDDQKSNEKINWHSRYDSKSGADLERMRAALKQLSDTDCIDIRWADNGPYSIRLKANGYDYFENKKKYLAMMKKEKRELLGRDIFLIALGALITNLDRIFAIFIKIGSIIFR